MPDANSIHWILDDLAVSTVMVVVTVALHGVALGWLGRLLRVEYSNEARHHIGPMSWRALTFTQAVVLALFVLHGIEIWLFAIAYVLLGAVADFSTALYFSTISYAAIGYSDIAIDPRWRLVGAIEGINGLLLLGWSTAFFVGFLTRLGRR
jgi:hypothetical protein